MVCVLNVVTARTSISITSYWCMIQGIPFFHPLSFDIQLKKKLWKKTWKQNYIWNMFHRKIFFSFYKEYLYITIQGTFSGDAEFEIFHIIEYRKFVIETYDNAIKMRSMMVKTEKKNKN